ncbi:Aquaporin-9 [Schistosoma japonicum]|uniref:Aquaporin-9 n=2 Tax=Schistosoma japonicum TaxID=6182 RepID=C1L813_SCHJA|nr:Aquaporin-9 [Schistosoma japonicum]KAH8857072.1 Aquaporin-9 [Schistosoma japonicum]TNN11184.1 Aquaporin-9 [Schistosoma japonicum]CAX70841.1 Aquaporin-9 (AQP-9) (Small solute channel 1) [Schistosoma japonicum]
MVTCGEKYVARQHVMADRLRLTSSPLLRACLGEFIGSVILLIFGSGVLAQVFLGDHGKHAHGTFISVSLGWGFAVYMGVFFSGQCGSGHINPAVTLASAIVGKLPFRRVPFYTFVQLLGAFLGSLVVFAVYREKILEYARLHDHDKLLLNSTGGIFVTNPSASHLTCFLDQILGTALLTAGAFAIIDRNGWNLPDHLHPLHLAFLVYALVGCFALNAGAALNPARDLGPRLMIFLFGWGSQAFSGANYFFWIPIVGPYIGAIIGGVLYELTIGIHLDRKSDFVVDVDYDETRSDGNKLMAYSSP